MFEHFSRLRIAQCLAMKSRQIMSEPRILALVESRGDIIPRPSQLDPDVLVSPHPAADVLSFR